MLDVMMVATMLLPLLVVFTILVVWSTTKVIVAVPPEHCTIVNKQGTLMYLAHGVHCLAWPLERAIEFGPTTKDGDKSRSIFLGIREIKVIEFEPLTSSLIYIHVDCTLYYKISDPIKALTVENIPNYLETQLKGRLTKLVGRTEFMSRNMSSNIQKNIVESINKRVSLYGIECVEAVVTDINVPEEEQETARQRFHKESYLENHQDTKEFIEAMEKLQKEHELNLVRLANAGEIKMKHIEHKELEDAAYFKTKKARYELNAKFIRKLWGEDGGVPTNIATAYSSALNS